ncbi:hypothetical protein [Streptomyces sp. CB02959]|uniref:hypothetical protein n=1 Tax=Streptomyces sp. CB02959 TaxID=2020330 RepID=UPI0021538C1E|nr:hypothetical protein [Streptomyces sp. CB02959]
MNKVAGRGWPWWAEALMICVVGAGTVQQAYAGAGATLLSPRVAQRPSGVRTYGVGGGWRVAATIPLDDQHGKGAA